MTPTPTQIAELKAKLAEAELKPLAQPEGEPVAIYQYQMANGSWIDQDKQSYDYNVRHGEANVRIVYTHPAPFTPKDIVEKCAQVCESRFRSLMADNNITAGNEAHKCASAVRHHGLTYPFTPITADDVTDEIVNAYCAVSSNPITKYAENPMKNALAAVVNAWGAKQ